MILRVVVETIKPTFQFGKDFLRRDELFGSLFGSHGIDFSDSSRWLIAQRFVC
jgi:hypothetical protein